MGGTRIGTAKAQTMLAREAGFDGSELHTRERLIPGTSRKQVTVSRSMPGTFENRYGRGAPGSMLDMLYQAGTEFARLCERCGHDAPGTVDFSKAGTTAWNGLPPSRLVALDQHKNMVRHLGKLVTARLQRYAVEGKTTRQIARSYRRSEREMRAILDSDLARAAVYFGYAPRR